MADVALSWYRAISRIGRGSRSSLVWRETVASTCEPVAVTVESVTLGLWIWTANSEEARGYCALGSLSVWDKLNGYCALAGAKDVDTVMERCRMTLDSEIKSKFKLLQRDNPQMVLPRMFARAYSFSRR